MICAQLRVFRGVLNFTLRSKSGKRWALKRKGKGLKCQVLSGRYVKIHTQTRWISWRTTGNNLKRNPRHRPPMSREDGCKHTVFVKPSHCQIWFLCWKKKRIKDRLCIEGREKFHLDQNKWNVPKINCPEKLSALEQAERRIAVLVALGVCCMDSIGKDHLCCLNSYTTNAVLNDASLV